MFFTQLAGLLIRLLSSFHQFGRDFARKGRIAILFHVKLRGVYPAAFNAPFPFLINMKVVREVFICVKILFSIVPAIIQEPGSGLVILLSFFF